MAWKHMETGDMRNMPMSGWMISIHPTLTYPSQI